MSEQGKLISSVKRDIADFEILLNEFVENAKNNLQDLRKFSLHTDRNLLSNEKEQVIEYLLILLDTHLGVSYELLKSKSREKGFLEARAIFVYILRKRFKIKLREIGDLLGGRSESAVKVYENRYKETKTSREIENELNSFISNIK